MQFLKSQLYIILVLYFVVLPRPSSPPEKNCGKIKRKKGEEGLVKLITRGKGLIGACPST